MEILDWKFIYTFLSTIFNSAIVDFVGDSGKVKSGTGRAEDF